MTQIRVIGEDGKPVFPEAGDVKMAEPEATVNAPVVQEIQVNAIADAMGLDKFEKTRYADNIETLLRYARANTKDHSTDGLKWAIRKLEVKLGSTPLSEKRISYLSRYAYLLLEKSGSRKELRSFRQ